MDEPHSLPVTEHHRVAVGDVVDPVRGDLASRRCGPDYRDDECESAERAKHVRSLLVPENAQLERQLSAAAAVNRHRPAAWMCRRTNLPAPGDLRPCLWPEPLGLRYHRVVLNRDLLHFPRGVTETVSEA